MDFLFNLNKSTSHIDEVNWFVNSITQSMNLPKPSYTIDQWNYGCGKPKPYEDDFLEFSRCVMNGKIITTKKYSVGKKRNSSRIYFEKKFYEIHKIFISKNLNIFKLDVSQLITTKLNRFTYMERSMKPITTISLTNRFKLVICTILPGVTYMSVMD